MLKNVLYLGAALIGLTAFADNAEATWRRRVCYGPVYTQPFYYGPVYSYPAQPGEYIWVDGYGWAKVVPSTPAETAPSSNSAKPKMPEPEKEEKKPKAPRNDD